MKLNYLGQLSLIAAMAMPLYSGLGQTPAAPTPPATTVATPPNNYAASPVMNPSSNVAEVIKLSKAGVGDGVVLAYVKNSRYPYNLKADQILQLKDAGVSTEVITAMLNHDSAMTNQNPPPAPAPAPAPPYVYNQQLYSGQSGPAQSVAQPPPGTVTAATQAQAQSQATYSAPPPDAGAPPPAQTEVVTVSPGADYYWAPGYWGWNDGWIWIGGGWFPRGYYGWGWGYRGGWGGYRGFGGYHGGGGFRGGGGFHGGGHR